jgi:hypothetical protein
MRTHVLTCGVFVFVCSFLVAGTTEAQQALFKVQNEEGYRVYLPVTAGSESQIKLGEAHLAFALDFEGETVTVTDLRAANGDRLRMHGAVSTAPSPILVAELAAQAFPVKLNHAGQELTMALLGIDSVIVRYEVTLPTGEMLRGATLDGKPFMLQMKGEGVLLTLRAQLAEASANVLPIQMVRQPLEGAESLRTGDLEAPEILRMGIEPTSIRVGTTDIELRAWQEPLSPQGLEALMPLQGEPMEGGGDKIQYVCCICCPSHPTCACGCAAECEDHSCCVGPCC